MAQDLHHVVFLHTELAQKEEDIYLINAAIALESIGHQVTIYTSTFDERNGLSPVHPIRGQLRVLLSGGWIPSNIFGALKNTMAKLKATWMALQLVLSPPGPKPKAIILDVDSLALLVLSWFTTYDTIYINHFPQLQFCDSFDSQLKIHPDFVTGKTIGYASKIVVQTHPLYHIFKRSFPGVASPVTVLYPCYDAGSWSENSDNVKNFLAGLPQDCFLFATFGSFRRRTNFALVLQALHYLYEIGSASLRKKIYIVIAGQCNEGYGGHERHYKILFQNVTMQSYSSHIIFLNNVPLPFKKALIHNCVAIIHPTIDDVYPGPVLTAMSLGRPVIAVNGGFAKDVLEHKTSAILLEPDPIEFAKTMLMLAKKPAMASLMGIMARERFDKFYSFEMFSRKLHKLVMKASH